MTLLDDKAKTDKAKTDKAKTDKAKTDKAKTDKAKLENGNTGKSEEDEKSEAKTEESEEDEKSEAKTEESDSEKNESNGSSSDDDDVLTPAIELKPLSLKDPEWAEDHVGLADGRLKDGTPVKEDSVRKLTHRQKKMLLRENGIDLNKNGVGIAQAFVDVANLERAANGAVQFKKVALTVPSSIRITRFSLQYDEHVFRLQRTSTTEGTASVGVPEIFRVEGSHRSAMASRIDERKVKVYESESHIMRRAHVLFADEQLSLTEKFVQEIKDAVNSPSSQGEKLLRALRTYGQFFASELVLGGRFTYWSDKTLIEAHEAKATEQEFRASVEGKASVNGVPVSGGTSTGHATTDSDDETTVGQRNLTQYAPVGGNTQLTSADKWIPTTAKYLNWKVIGFGKHSLVPTIDYLRDDELRAKCIKVLRNYFTSKLQLRSSETAAASTAAKFGYEAGSERVKRIVRIDVNHGDNVDKLRVTYELLNGVTKEMPELGKGRGEHNSTVGPLPFDEEITAIEVGYDDLVRRLAFKTSKGNRFPEGTDYYGREAGRKLEYVTIEAPRICGLVGTHGNQIDSIGLRFRELGDDTNERDFLLEMEPYLFPINIAPAFDMTIRGVLLAGNFRSQAQLDSITADDKRNTLIAELVAHSNEQIAFFHERAEEVLVGFGAVVVFLKAAKLHDQGALKKMSCDAQRNALITFIHSYTDEEVSKLQAMATQDLVRWGFAIKGKVTSLG